jgi:hypothetical protein
MDGQDKQDKRSKISWTSCLSMLMTLPIHDQRQAQQVRLRIKDQKILDILPIHVNDSADS